MKIKIQRIGAPRFEIEVDPNDKVSDLKEKIESVLGSKNFPAARQFLIYRGRFIISVNGTLRELNIVEDGVVSVFAIARVMLPQEACRSGTYYARASWAWSPAPVAPVISSAVSELDDRMANLNVVSGSDLSMRKDPKLGVEVCTEEEEFEWEACENETSVKSRDGFM